MGEDPIDDGLARLRDRRSEPRPLSPEAQARIEARLDVAFDAEAARTDRDATVPVVDVVPGETRHRPRTRRGWVVPLAGAAAAGLLVVALVSRREPAATTEQPRPPIPAALLEPGTRWELVDANASALEEGSTASITVRVLDDVVPDGQGRAVTAEARVSTGDAPPLQYLGSVAFAVGPSGALGVPLVLLQPERGWVDCEATVDLGRDDTVVCGADTVTYAATSTRSEMIDTSLDSYRATGSEVEWTVGDSDTAGHTTIWTAPAVGPVRIDVADGDRQVTYLLVSLETAEATPGARTDHTTTTTPTGD